MPLLISCKCDCCRQGCGEVKCPYCIDGTDFDSYMQKKSFCLEKKKQFCVQFEKRSWLLSGPATNPHYWLWLLSFRVGCSQGQIMIILESKQASQDNQCCPCSATTKWIRLWSYMPFPASRGSFPGKEPLLVEKLAIGYTSSLTFINDSNITFQRLIFPDLLEWNNFHCYSPIETL